MQRVTIEDYGKVVEPGEAKFSPDGRQIAYMHKGEPFIVPADDSKGPVKLSKAGSKYQNTRPVWSLDGKYLHLVYYNKESQEYEIYAVTADDTDKWSKQEWVNTEVYEWPTQSYWLSPGKAHWLSTKSELAEHSSNKSETPEGAPIVIEAMVFKKDGSGYLTADASDSLYITDSSTEKSTRLTNKEGHDTQPVWSPDGTKIAFIREDLSKAEYRSDLCVISSGGTANGKPEILTSSPGERRSPVWSPDGKQIAYLWQDCELGPYAVKQIALFSLGTGREKILTKKHDRMVTSFRFSGDGRYIYFLFDNEGGSHLARIRLRDNRIETLVSDERFVTSFDLNEDGQVALNMKTMKDAIDIYIMKDGSLKRLTNMNRGYFENRELGSKEQLYYSPKSGPRIQALVTKPVGFDPSKKYPAVLRIHGGPVLQAKFGYEFITQFLAANGYVVVEPNPPGSTGRGQDFIESVRSDWGFKKHPDVLGAIDEVVKLGYADPKRLAVIGYSYGGYMTNCIITLAPKKFKAAVSGAGHSFIAANYGHDKWLKWYNWGLGHPWLSRDRKRYEKLSPLNDAEKVQTPTLFLCGAKDWNVPVINAELFYQALRVRGIPTRLVVYPDAAAYRSLERRVL